MLTVRFPLLRLPPRARVLDLGCGEGRHVHGLYLLTDAHATGLDPDEPSLAIARDRLADLPPGRGTADFLQGSAYALPFAAGTFDAVICSEVLEHLADYPAALAEIARVLKPEGIFAATVPRRWPERICWRLAPGTNGYADQPGGHVRIFAEADLRRTITAAGFAFRTRHFAHALHTPLWWLKTAVWSRRDDHPLVRAYHAVLVWDMMKHPWITRTLERVSNPLMGKSLALYFERHTR